MAAHILKIEACAGAGKTYRLTQRFLELLRPLPPHPRSLRSLVAITFTNKAAAEMKERLLRALKEIALGLGPKGQTSLMSPAQAEAWLKIIFEHYPDLQVRTIDSLVFTILKGIALELGLRPDLEAELKEDLLLERAYDRLLVALGEGKDALIETFRQVLYTYLEIESRGGFNPEKRIRRTLLEIFRYETKGEAPLIPCEDQDLKEEEQALRQAAQAFLAAVEEHKVSFRYRSWPKYFLDPLANLRATPFHKESSQEVLRKTNDELEALYQGFRQALDRYLLTRAIGRLIPYARLYSYLQEELATLRQQEGIIHGGAWVNLVGKVLEEAGVPLIYCKLGAQFYHFLVDEFQDTSRPQWAALRPLVEESLAQGGSFTYVGDVKQAIYVWRGGDPALFSEVPLELPAELREEVLPYNWRSRAALVEFNNEVFTALAKESTAFWVAQNLLYGKQGQKEAQRCPVALRLSHEIQDAFSRVRQELSPLTPPGGNIQIRVYEGQGLQERAAAVEALLTQDLPEVFARYKGRGQVAVLVRTNDQAEDMARLLFSLKIPAVTENALRVAGSRLVRWLIALLTFLDYPYNDVALAGVLRSPLVAPYFDAKAFFKTRVQSPLMEQVRLQAPEFWRDFLAPLLAKAGVLSPYDLLREILDVFAVYERFPEEKAFLYRFLSLVLAFEQEGGGLSAFLERWQERGLEERLGLPEDVSAVRVLTIHAAKGLEFHAVFLPYLHWTLKPNRLVTLEDGSLGYAQTPYPQALRKVVLAERAKQALETLNLLYVAFTRAKEELFIYVPKPEQGRYARFGSGDIVYRLLQETGYLGREHAS